ncbi:Serine/threonine-protein kinase rio1 [Smittium culicis]|uniref:Serine/threonine-protein kinase RIO1 n=1 Tax=Smittium culicis TaxID=133412 RepID=A0A1R1Y6Y8_9FUNG|nr:Serine/threonine-protein kinase rio1 [Smittium culicis]
MENSQSATLKSQTEIDVEQDLELENDLDYYLSSDLDLDSDELVSYEGDWAETRGDFTKKYNRLRDFIHSQNNPTTPTSSKKSTVAPKPAINSSGKAINDLEKTRSLNTMSSIDTKSQLIAKFSNRIHLENYQNITNSSSSNSKVSSKKSFGSNKGQVRDRANRATTEQVLDPRTRMILFKLLNQGVVYEINGSINMGKEANVYHAVTEDGQHRAIKVYKTSILIFKDRDRYFTGEYRFRNGYSRHNPRKMVKLWAEKEMRNLKRIHQAGILCPEPLVLRQHVLVMNLLGDKDGWAYPRLKDATIKKSRYPDLYFQIVTDMRIMYQVCKLVHADLSEYNILYHNKKLYIIDVSQSVEHDHPYALDFLRSDCTNINDYFSKNGVHTLGLRQLFDFITNPKLGNTAPEFEEELINIGKSLEKMSEAEISKQLQDDLVFKQSFIPRNLFEVLEYERDVDKLNRGDTEDMLYMKMSGLALESQPDTTPEPAAMKKDLDSSIIPQIKKSDESGRTLNPSHKNIELASTKPLELDNENVISSSISKNPSKKVTFDNLDSVQLIRNDLSDSQTRNSDEPDTKNESNITLKNVESIHSDVDLSSKASTGIDNANDDNGNNNLVNADDSGSENSNDEDGSDSDSEDDDEEGEEREWKERKTEPRGKRFLDKDAKKEHKQNIKSEKREKRKTKIKKSVKKRKEQLTSGRKSKK